MFIPVTMMAVPSALMVIARNEYNSVFPCDVEPLLYTSGSWNQSTGMGALLEYGLS